MVFLLVKFVKELQVKFFFYFLGFVLSYDLTTSPDPIPTIQQVPSGKLNALRIYIVTVQ